MRKKYTFRETLRPLSFLLRRMLCYPGLLLLSGLTLVITTACTLVIPYFSKLIINDYILTGDLPGPSLHRQYHLHLRHQPNSGAGIPKDEP